MAAGQGMHSILEEDSVLRGHHTTKIHSTAVVGEELVLVKDGTEHYQPPSISSQCSLQLSAWMNFVTLLLGHLSACIMGTNFVGGPSNQSDSALIPDMTSINYVTHLSRCLRLNKSGFYSVSGRLYSRKHCPQARWLTSNIPTYNTVQFYNHTSLSTLSYTGALSMVQLNVTAYKWNYFDYTTLYM